MSDGEPRRAETGEVVPGASTPEEAPPLVVGRDWEWRRRVRANPATYRVYRLVVGVVGSILVVGGLALVPLPGPGWLIVIIGLAVLSTEFERAQRLLGFVRTNVRAWERWMARQAWYVQGVVGLLTFAFVAAVVWATLRVFGLPEFVPIEAGRWLVRNLGLSWG
ncbi:TIGR02611 family protein [Phycicoccus avicenniae]|uniref:TIGR02611 family protein n=1 Tax=Phycicoccus avicenniae TaxID=2828860 RepID=UPI0020133715|nr:TIGR02611 family protein [Phycicoccus avicenniae]